MRVYLIFKWYASAAITSVLYRTADSSHRLHINFCNWRRSVVLFGAAGPRRRAPLEGTPGSKPRGKPRSIDTTLHTHYSEDEAGPSTAENASSTAL